MRWIFGLVFVAGCATAVAEPGTASGEVASDAVMQAWGGDFFKSMSGSDCKGIASGDKSYCNGNFCKGIASGDKSYCDDNDCKGVASKDKSYCDSNTCKAWATGDKSYCD